MQGQNFNKEIKKSAKTDYCLMKAKNDIFYLFFTKKNTAHFIF
jgi:hypothetical protein